MALLSRRPAAWHRTGFRQLVRAWLFTNVADSALFLMVAVWVKDMTGSDAAAATVFVVFGVPALLAPFIGQLADRSSRKRLLTIANFVMVPILVSLFAVGGVGQLWLIYVVVFLYGTMAFLTGAAGSGLIRDLLPDEELASGNGTLQTIDSALRLISPLIGTALYVVVGPLAVVALAAACFAATGFLMSRLEIEESPLSAPAPGSSYWSELSAGFRHLFRTPVLSTVTIALTVTFGIVGLVNAAIFPIMEQGLGLEAAMLGVFVSLQGLGLVAGGITSSAVVRRFSEMGAVALGCLLLGVGLTPYLGTSIVMGLVGMVTIGVGIPWIVVAYSTLRQRLTPAELQGRTAAASNVALNLPQTMALLVAIAVIESIDYRILILVAVVVTLVCALAASRTRTVESA